MNSYRVRVVRPSLRRVTFLWGGDRVEVNLSSPLLLTFRVPDDGEPIQFGVTKSAPRREIRLGRLELGESFTVPLSGLSGVYAVSEQDTYVDCQIAAALPPDAKSKLSGVPGV